MHAWQSCFAMTSHYRLIILFIYFYLMTCQGIWHPFFQVFCFPSKLHEEEKSKITINLRISFPGKAPVPMTCNTSVVSRLFILIFKQGRAVWHLFSLQHFARRKQNWQSTCSWKDVLPALIFKLCNVPVCKDAKQKSIINLCIDCHNTYPRKWWRAQHTMPWVWQRYLGCWGCRT